MPPARCVFHVVLLDVRRHLAQLRHLRDRRSMSRRSTAPRPPGRRPQVQDGIGRAAHGDVQGHGVLEGLEVGDVARQHAVVAFAVIALAEFHGQRPARRNSCSRSAWVARVEPLPGSDRPSASGQAVHRVGGEHAEQSRRSGRRCARTRRPSRRSRESSAATTMASTRSRPWLARLGRTASARRRRTPPGCSGAARQHAGVILSQLEMQTMASAQWALTMYSTESAMISRLGGE